MANSLFLLQLGLPNTYTEKQTGRQVSGAGQFHTFGPNMNHTDVV